MRSIHLIPVVYLVCAMISLTILQSIAVNLVVSQALFYLIGALVFFAVSMIHTRWWQLLLPFAYGSVVLALCATLALGTITRGSTRWISVGSVNLQPSQIALSVTILTASVLFSRVSLEKFSHLIFALGVVSVPIGLIFIEPDLDTTIVISATIGMMLLHSRIPVRTLLIGAATTCFLGMIAWNFLLHPYQKQRVFSFLGSSDLDSAGYNAKQSMVAVGSGQWTGRGLGHGVQSQLRFLPERQTDFIFASIAEETGFLGAALVLMTYCVLIGVSVHVLARVTDPFRFLLLLGCTTVFTLQVGVNVGMNMGILPIAGLTLPLISYGGSSILGFAILCGLMQRVMIDEQSSRTLDIR